MKDTRDLIDDLFPPLFQDDLRILIACGASPNDQVTQGKCCKNVKIKALTTNSKLFSLGLRPLHYAVWQRYLEAVQFLLVRGSDVNARDDCGYSALHLSAEHGYTEIMSLLLEYQVRNN